MASNPRGIASAGSCQRITRSPRRPIRSGVRRWQSGSVLVANRRKPSCRLPKWSQHPQSGVAANRDRQPRSSLRAAARSEHRKPSGLYPVASVLWVRRRSPPAMKRRAIGPGGRQTGGPARRCCAAASAPRRRARSPAATTCASFVLRSAEASQLSAAGCRALMRIRRSPRCGGGQSSNSEGAG